MTKHFCIFLLLLFYLSVHAQDNYRFSSYTANDGLPQSSVWDIIQDKNGFIWVGTSDGLCRFDGFKFTVYRNNPKDSTSINCDKDNTFFIDKQQQLWIVSAKGVSLYDDATDHFKNIFTYNPIDIPIASHNYIYGECNGFIWVGLCKYGLLKINVATKQCFQIKQVGNTILSDYTYWLKGIIEDGKIYGNANADFFKYDIERKQFIINNEIRNAKPTIEFSKDELLTCNTQTLFFVNKKTSTVRKLPLQLPKSVQLVSDICFNAEDRSQIIIATPVGLQYVDIASGKLIKTLKDFDPDKQIKYSYAECLFTDKSGNFWIGTNGDGLRKMSFPFKKFNYYSTQNAKSNLVKSMYVDSTKAYIGYFNNGFDIFSRKKGFEKNIDVSVSGSTANNNVYGIIPINKENLLIYVFGEKGMTFFSYSIQTDKQTDVTRKFETVVPTYPALHNCPFCFFRNSDGTILAGCNEYLLKITFPKSIAIPEVTVLDKLPDEIINCIFQDSENELWVGTYKGAYHFINGKWNSIDLKKSFLIKSINRDNNDDIWIGGTEGLYVLDRNDKIKNIYTEQTGLPSHHIYGILKDNDGNMWYSSNKGIGVFKVKEKQFQFYTKEDGLQGNEFNGKAFFKAPDGALFFGGVNGTNSFYPKEVSSNPNIPAVKITSIKLFDEPYKTDSAYWNIHSLTLPYTENSLSFEFIMPEFTNPQKNQYAYMMEGVDKNWIDANDKRFARYAGLGSGKYVFKVKACNDDGVWVEHPTTISITIVPPIWQRTWFILLAALCGITLIASIVIFIQKEQFKKKLKALELQQKIQLERERISRDLHDNVGTQLSLISKNIEEMIHPLNTTADDDKAKNLVSVSQTSKEVIATLRETIWALNKEEISIEEFSDKLKVFVRKQVQIFTQLQLQYNEHFENGLIILNPSEAKHLFRICQEAIANSLKYANATTLSIDLYSTTEKYTILIVDDGKGFTVTKGEDTPHYGLDNMKFRATEIACIIEIDSMPNKGTKITLQKT